MVTILLALAALGCSNSNNSPTGPSTTAQVGGDWTYTLRLSGVSGGDCVGNALQGVVGATDSGPLIITQTGSSLSATIGDPTVGTCSYTGNVSGDSLTLNLTRCDGGMVLGGFPCSNGVQRDLEYVSNAINASVSGNNASGTSVETYNVYATGTTNRISVMTLNASFSAVRR
jgi:hypothetical protein